MAFHVRRGTSPPSGSVHVQAGMAGRRIASVAMGGLLMLISGSATGHVPPPLVEYLPDTELDAAALSADQRTTLDSIRDDPAAAYIRIGPADQNEARDTLATSLVLPEPPGVVSETIASFHNLQLEGGSEQGYSLYSHDETSGSEIALVVLGPDVLGTVRHDGALYKVLPLGDGLTAVYRYDPDRLPPDAALAVPESEKRRQRVAVPPSAGAAASDESPVVDIMVAYTRRARIQTGNIDAFIRFAFDQTNRVFANSRMQPRIRLVHSYQTGYAQGDTLSTDLERLVSPEDGHMDDVHSRRDEHAADVVVLLVGNRDSGCSVLYGLPSEQYAFAAIARNCLGANGLARELGVMHGASSNPEAGTNFNFPYGHGLCNDPDNWRTVMAWNWDNRCPVPIPYFSNPEVSYAGTPTGDTELHDNARVINETARRIAAFRQAAPPARSFVIPLFMPADNPTQQGFARITNRSYRAGRVRIHAIDDTGARFGPVFLSVARRASAHFNSDDLEAGNPEKGLDAGVGDGTGNWRLALDTELDIEPRAYVRTSDGFLTSVHEVAGSVGPGSRRFRVPIFNPASNRQQQSLLRLINPGDTTARIVISGLDDRGAAAPEGKVTLRLQAGWVRMLSAQELEAGGEDLSGRFGNGTGKWRLDLSSSHPIVVMSLLQSPTGNVTNLSP